MTTGDRVAFGFLLTGLALIIAGTVHGGPWLPLGLLCLGCFVCTPSGRRR